ncbi:MULTISPECIES: hypothetical protein [unclassified Bradyrhizobium]|uniref:hypothetical protein n=1 Tax=unclassified Bradyrhizobium TaxID=2631580 RepID=UPI0003F61509|nr:MULTISPECIES: hypothetical protein [unclassified Bradyrhizobium]QIG91765.1 hypothetical protein G6P99_04040 [Bradyrhizobium sp. 6(2017)]
MSLRSVRYPGSPCEPGRFAATTLRFTPQAPCGPIEPVFPALLRSLVFFTALALPFVVALFAA